MKNLIIEHAALVFHYCYLLMNREILLQQYPDLEVRRVLLRKMVMTLKGASKLAESLIESSENKPTENKPTAKRQRRK